MKKLISSLLLVATLLTLLVFELPAVAVEADILNETVGEEEALPSSATLVGTKHLPPISNQGEVGCCSSSAIAYMQFTNAVSRYIEANEPDKTFEPATGEKEYLMSPKFTFFLSGSGTAYVYNILLENGCLTLDRSSFYYNNLRGYTYHHWAKPKVIHPEFCDWDVKAGEMEEALNYRLTDYEQIWMNDVYKVDGKVQLTNTEIGKQLLEKIKRSLVNGNVVVTGGLSSVWVGYNYVSKKGDIAKKGEQALAYSAGKPAGGHQVCIVGYDDNVECKVNGVTLKGAFLVANSWGTAWMNDGYVWLMYDALNQVSEYPELNVEDRYFTMDQFCFTDWKTDITSGKPDLYVELTVTAENRDTVYFETLRKDNSGEKSENYFMFTDYLHPDLYDDDHKHGSYFNFSGEADGEAVKGVITLSYNDLLKAEEGKSFADYKFGFSMRARKGDFTAHSAVLKNADGAVIAEMDLKDQTIGGSTQKFYFEEELYKVELSSEKGEGFTVKELNGYYPKGSKLDVVIDYAEGFKAASATVTANGKELESNEKGVFTLTVEKDTVATVKVVAEKETKPVKGYQAYITADTVEMTVFFYEEFYGKKVTLTVGGKTEEVTADKDGATVTMAITALADKITVTAEETTVEYTLKQYFESVSALESASEAQKAVATALLAGTDHTEYLTKVKNKEE